MSALYNTYFISSQGIGGFLPGVKQIANVAALPGIVGVSVLNNFYIFKLHVGIVNTTAVSVSVFECQLIAPSVTHHINSMKVSNYF